MKRRTFRRPLPDRRYKKLFVIATEGAQTEPQYFELFNREARSVVHVKCLKGKHDSSPARVLTRMTGYIKQEALTKEDEAWLVVDKDQWNDRQLEELLKWVGGRDNYGLALSNPNFEFWLLLHFEAGEGVTSARRCLEKLKKYLPSYSKNINPADFPRERVLQAINRASKRDNPPCKGWPRSPGSTVYKLVSRILNMIISTLHLACG